MFTTPRPTAGACPRLHKEGDLNWLIVFLGSGIGGAFRYGAQVLALRLGWTTFPIATLAVNVIGSFLIGLVAGYAMERAQFPANWRLFLTTGLIGGFTTFSSFSLDVALLWEHGKVVLAATYVLASVALSIAALFAALAIVQAGIRP